MKFAFVAKHRHIWPVLWICEALGASRSGFRAWLSRLASAHALADERLLAEITRSFHRSDRTYGARRVWHDMLAEGFGCGLRRVKRLMGVNKLRARRKRRGLPKDDGARLVIAGNLLGRDFQADRPNQKWLADFTCIRTAKSWLCVAVVMDLVSRRIVGCP